MMGYGIQAGNQVLQQQKRIGELATRAKELDKTTNMNDLGLKLPTLIRNFAVSQREDPGDRTGSTA